MKMKKNETVIYTRNKFIGKQTDRTKEFRFLKQKNWHLIFNVCVFGLVPGKLDQLKQTNEQNIPLIKLFQ